jgi:hypothetical protein
LIRLAILDRGIFGCPLALASKDKAEETVLQISSFTTECIADYFTYSYIADKISTSAMINPLERMID